MAKIATCRDPGTDRMLHRCDRFLWGVEYPEHYDGQYVSCSYLVFDLAGFGCGAARLLRSTSYGLTVPFTADEFRNDPRNPNAKNGKKPAEKN